MYIQQKRDILLDRKIPSRTMAERKHETSIAVIQYLNQGVIKVSIKDNAIVTKEGLQENREVYRKLLQGEKGLFLTVFNESNTAGMNIKEEYEGLERVGMKEAEAFVISSLSNRIELDYFTQMTKTLYPTRFFHDEKEAMKWLLDFQQ